MEYEVTKYPTKNGESDFTIIKKDIQSDKSVLYLHGFLDYFFQDHLAEFFIELGYNFYAIDLRKHGRSLRESDLPNYTRNIEEYFEEIDFTLEQIKSKEVVLFGHSTGGLTASAYIKFGKNKDRISRVILNSPFLDFNMPEFIKKPILPLLIVIGKQFPEIGIPGMLSPKYTKSVHKDFSGEWDFSTKLKPIKGFPVYLGWFVAINKMQNKIKTTPSSVVPTLMLTSHQSNKSSDNSDIVLNVKDMWKHIHHVSKNFKIEIIKNGIHDLSLSKEQPRKHFFQKIKEFLPK